MDDYKRKGNKYVNDNIEEIQELYRNKELRRETTGKERIQDEEVVLFKPYKELAFTTSKTIGASFIYKEIKNLE